jgi:8-oxo-dGTP diphosphatase
VVDRFRLVPAVYVVLRRASGTGSSGRHAPVGEDISSPHQVDEVLLQLRQGTGYMDGYWATAAAGHVEQDESVFESAVRESREELDIIVNPADLVPMCGMHRTHRNHDPIDERVDFFFACEHWSGEPRIVEGDKAADLRWFRVDRLPANVVPHERLVLESMRDGRLPPVVAFGFVDPHTPQAHRPGQES